jgi:putative flippase GtrA
MKTLFKEAFGYTAASGCALAVDIAVLWGFVYFLSVPYLIAAIISFLTGSVVAYALSVKFVFKHHRLRERRSEFAAFAAIGAAGLAVNTGVIFIAVNYFGLYYLVAKFVAAGFTFTFNFLTRRQILFVQHQTCPIELP